MVRLKATADGKFALNDLYFNSSMVRLKAVREILEYAVPTNFNSSMVRLKEICLNWFFTNEIHFNSSMVRLKDDPTQSTKKKSATFQFLNGSIKRIESLSNNSGIHHISIPQWFD